MMDSMQSEIKKIENEELGKFPNTKDIPWLMNHY